MPFSTINEKLLTINKTQILFYMQESTMNKKVLGNERGIKNLVGKTEKIENKLKRMSEELRALKRENKELKKLIKYAGF